VRKKEEEREFLKQQTISVDEDISLLVKFKLDFFAPQIVYDSMSAFHMVGHHCHQGGKCNKNYFCEQVVTVPCIRVINLKIFECAFQNT